jgi:hypothetical protein
MKLKLEVSETLIWHDGPQLFVANDSIDGLYLCLATGDGTTDTPQFIAVAISPMRLQSFKLGKTDLHDIFKSPELNNWLSVDLSTENQLIASLYDVTEGLPEHLLPESGVLLFKHHALRPEIFEAVKMSAVAKEANMNPALLRQYVIGAKSPSPEQAHRIQTALHRVGQRLLELRLV